MNRPNTTLFMLSSLDGKISTGDTDIMDVDADFPMIKGLKEGLSQYYDLEKKTDFFSLNSGRIFAKIGYNEKKDEPVKIPVTFVVIDNKPHLNGKGIRYICKKGEKLILVTTNKRHSAFSLKKDLKNLDILSYNNHIDFTDMFTKLKSLYKAKRITVQSGGTLNAEFIRAGLIDRISLVIAPVMIGGKNTATLMDGESLHSKSELFKLKSLKLESVKKLENSYLHLIYKVLN